MIQVDVFWSFAMGASLAAAAAEPLRKERSLVVNKYFIYTLLYLSLIFAPSGAYLLWQHTGWETLFMLSPPELHGLAVCAFASTNVLLGVVGFLLCGTLLKGGRDSLVHALWTGAYTCMFSILSFGYDRFLYAGSLEEWRKGVKYPLGDFFSSEIFYTLLVMGLFVIPPLYYATIVWPTALARPSDEARWLLLQAAITPFYRLTGIIISTYLVLWKFTRWLPLGWGVDRLFAFLIGQAVFGACIFAPIGFIPVQKKGGVKFRRD